MVNPSSRRLPGLVLAAAALVAVVIVGAVVFWASPGGTPSIGGPFTLQDGDGRTVSDRDFRGRWMLVYFGYTFCPDVCPTTLNQVAEAMDKLGPKADGVAPVFITVDPARDTPSVVKQYAAAFTPRLVGLTGTPDAIAAVAREYRVYYAVHRTGAGPGDYTMDHSSILYLVDPAGRFVAPIRADGSGTEIAAALSHYLSS